MWTTFEKAWWLCCVTEQGENIKKTENCIRKRSPMDYTCKMSPLQRQKMSFNICICQQQFFLAVCDNQFNNFNHWFYDALNVFDWWIILLYYYYYYNYYHYYSMISTDNTWMEKNHLDPQEDFCMFKNKLGTITKFTWAGPRNAHSRFNCPM